MPDTNPTVLVENEAAVRTLRLNRPDRLNAFNDDLLETLGKEVTAAARDQSVRCLVITGAGRAFCAGQDIDVLRQRMDDPDAPDLGAHIRKFYNPMFTTLYTMEKPVIAGINGIAAGAGCSLALACDLRIAAKSAGFIEAFINLGLVPDCASTYTLPRLIGLTRAMEMCITGRKVGAEEALRIGLVNQIVPDEELPATTMQMAQKLAAMPTRGIGLTKRAFNRTWTATLEEQLDYEAFLQATAQQTEDHAEGLQAFLDKRKPQFKGR